MERKRYISGSLLPSTPDQLFIGNYEVRPLPELDTHGLFWRHTYDGKEYASLVAVQRAT